MAKSPQNNMWIVVIGVGLIALLLGVFTELYSSTIGIIVAVIVWIAGMPLLKIVMGSSEQKPATEQQKPMQAEQEPMEPVKEEEKTEETPSEQPPMEEPKQDA